MQSVKCVVIYVRNQLTFTRWTKITFLTIYFLFLAYFIDTRHKLLFLKIDLYRITLRSYNNICSSRQTKITNIEKWKVTAGSPSASRYIVIDILITYTYRYSINITTLLYWNPILCSNAYRYDDLVKKVNIKKRSTEPIGHTI